MKPKTAHLEQIQRWMQSVITHPGGVSEGVDSPEARGHLDVPLEQLDSVIEPSRAMDSSQRLEIYVDAYYERLLECLRQEFDATRYAVGEELFDALAFGYLQHYPSRSYTLYRLGDKFAGYLAESRLHAQAVPVGAPESWADFVVELATFERVQREVFDAPGTERMSLVEGEQLSKIPPDAWESVRLVVAPCLRLCAFAHPLHTYWTAWRQEGQPTAPPPRPTYLAINRRAYVLERVELTRVQYTLLTSLAQGDSLWEAIGTAASQDEGNAAPLETGLRDWFAAWTRGGFFVDIAPSRQSGA